MNKQERLNQLEAFVRTCGGLKHIERLTELVLAHAGPVTAEIRLVVEGALKSQGGV